MKCLYVTEAAEFISEENTNASFAVGSKWVFPRPTDPTKHINNSSYRVKLRNFITRWD